MKKIEFFFDFLSPFSYFSWKNHKKFIDVNKYHIIYRPVLMGRLFAHHGFPGPGEITAKRNYELKKCFKYAAKNSIPFTPPSSFPFNPLAIIRMATQTAAGEQQEQMIEKIFNLVWGEGQVLEDPDLIKELTRQGEIFEASFTKEAKLELKQNIKDAINSDIFGVPSFKVDSEFFWGNDSFEDLSNYLKGNDNWNKELYNSLIKE